VFCNGLRKCFFRYFYMCVVMFYVHIPNYLPITCLYTYCGLHTIMWKLSYGLYFMLVGRKCSLRC